MTIETQQSKIQYQGNGSTTIFPLPFPVLRAEHVHVWVSTGGAGQQVTAGFSVVGTLPAGASVQFAVAPADGVLVTLARVVPLVQQTALRDGSSFSATVVEGTFDGQEMQVQQLAEGLDRAITVPVYSDTTPEDLLASIYTAQADAKGAATAANAAQGAAENAASRARASEELAAKAKADACACADIAEAAKDVAIAQAKATNALMAAEVGKINTLIADNEQGQAAAVDAARAWAETPHGVPVDVDGDGNPRYSAKHFAAEAQAISIPAGDEEQPGVLRLGTKEEHKDGAAGVAAQCSEVLRMVKEVLPAHTPEDKGKTLGLATDGSLAWVIVKNPMWRPGQKVELPGTKLYPNCVWPDRSLVLFADWPELHAEFTAGYLGTVAEADAPKSPDFFVEKADGSGLYLPDIGGLFARAWRPGEMQWDKGRQEGSYQAGSVGPHTHPMRTGWTGTGWNLGTCVAAVENYYLHSANYNCGVKNGAIPENATVGNHPDNYAQPTAIYLGHHASEV